MTTTKTTTELMDYAYEVGADLHHTTVCHKCGDTDYECQIGRDLRLGADSMAHKLHRNLAADIEAVLALVDAKQPIYLGRAVLISTAWEAIKA